MGSSCEIGLKSNQKLVGYTHDVHATISPWECHVNPIIVLLRVHCKVILMVLFSNSSLNSTFQTYEGSLAEMKLLVQYQVHFPLFCGLGMFCFQQQSLTIKFFWVTKMMAVAYSLWV